MVKYGACDYRIDGEVAILTCENPPVNQLSLKLRNGLFEGVKAANNDPRVRAMVLIGGGRTFIAGADIKEFSNGDAFKGAGLDVIQSTFEESNIPIVAAIHGHALGGGLEVAMVCHYRLGSSLCKVGQPEVLIGLLPGAGGTQRLPRLCGPFLAAELCATGQHVKAARALQCGILDRVVNCTKANEFNTLLNAAVGYAREVIGQPLGPRIVANMPCEKLDEYFVEQISKMVGKKARNMKAPLANVEAVVAATKLPFREGMKAEQKLFRKLMVGSEARALQHVFFSQRACSKVPGINKKLAIPVKSIGIIGCGQMGGGIAMCFVKAGIHVTIIEIKQEYLDKGMGLIKGNWMRKVKKGKMTKKQVKSMMNLIKPSLKYEDLRDVDLVIEAAFESMDIKKKVFMSLDRHCKPSCILASNTSSLDIDKIAAFTNRPEKVVGMHFFSPANVMQLLENIRGAKSSVSTLATVMQVGKVIKKIPVLVGNCRGFVGNRMVFPYAYQASMLLMEGATPMQVDQALYKFGMAMGPIAMGDLSGLDIGYKMRKAVGSTDPSTRPRGMMYPYNVQDKLVKLNRLGQKTGKGIFDYKGRKPIESSMVNAMFEEERKKMGLKQQKFSDKDIVERCLFPLVNEGLKCLEEGIALRALDIDIIYIYGYGFPPYRGGPMHWADSIGMRKIRDSLRKWEGELPNPSSFKPCKLLNQLADKRLTLAKYMRKQAKAKSKL